MIWRYINSMGKVKVKHNITLFRLFNYFNSTVLSSTTRKSVLTYKWISSFQLNRIYNFQLDMTQENTDILNTESTSTKNSLKKSPKRGIIYLSTIPPYMNVTKIREVFGEFGTVGRVYLQLADKELNGKEKKTKKHNVARKFTEGWIEFERKSVAKKVATLLNNTQVSNRKKSKHYDYIWNIKYLSSFKWTHLHERLAYEKAARRQKLRAEIQLAKKKTNYFSANLNKTKKDKTYVNKEYENLSTKITQNPETANDGNTDRTKFLQSLFP